MLSRRALKCLLAIVGAAAACSRGTDVHIRPCTAADAAVTLAVDEYVSIDPASNSGCSVFPATTSLAARYLVMPQLATGVPGQIAGFRLGGDTILPVPPPASCGSATSGASGVLHPKLLSPGPQRYHRHRPRARRR